MDVYTEEEEEGDEGETPEDASEAGQEEDKNRPTKRAGRYANHLPTLRLPRGEISRRGDRRQITLAAVRLATSGVKWAG